MITNCSQIVNEVMDYTSLFSNKSEHDFCIGIISNPESLYAMHKVNREDKKSHILFPVLNEDQAKRAEWVFTQKGYQVKSSISNNVDGFYFYCYSITPFTIE